MAMFLADIMGDIKKVISWGLVTNQMDPNGDFIGLMVVYGFGFV